MKKSRLLGAVIAALMAVTALPSTASVVYTYTGNAFNDLYGSGYSSSNRVTGFVQLPDALAYNNDGNVSHLVEKIVFTDGVHTLSDQSADYFSVIFDIAFDGSVRGWQIGLATNFNSPSFLGDISWNIGTTGDYQTTIKDADSGSEATCIHVHVNGGCDGANVTYGRVYANQGSWQISNVSAVPVPAAAWLFGSGLLGLVGIARRKAA